MLFVALWEIKYPVFWSLAWKGQQVCISQSLLLWLLSFCFLTYLFKTQTLWKCSIKLLDSTFSWEMTLVSMASQTRSEWDWTQHPTGWWQHQGGQLMLMLPLPAWLSKLELFSSSYNSHIVCPSVNSIKHVFTWFIVIKLALVHLQGCVLSLLSCVNQLLSPEQLALANIYFSNK